MPTDERQINGEINCMETSIGSILITGATGFIGRRLGQRLVKDGYSVRCMVRQTASAVPDGAEIVRGDLLEPATLDKALAGIDIAYYLVHSMSGGRAGFERRDREAARNFVGGTKKGALFTRGVFLGGGGGTGERTSQ